MKKDSVINSIPTQKEQCNLAHKDAMNAGFPGAILFADENAVEVAGSLNMATNGRTVLTNDLYREAWPRPECIGIQIIGCFDYTLPSNEHGQSGFNYTIERRLPNDIPSCFPVKSGPINSNDILFERDFFSGGYYK